MLCAHWAHGLPTSGKVAIGSGHWWTTLISQTSNGKVSALREAWLILQLPTLTPMVQGALLVNLVLGPIFNYSQL